MNLFTLAGTVVREPHFSSQGRSPCLSFTVLSVRKWNDKEFKTYCDVVLFGERAKQIEGTIKTADYVIAKGEASAEIYESKGDKKAKLKMFADSVEVVAQTSAQRNTPKTAVEPGNGDTPTDETDDAPF